MSIKGMVQGFSFDRSIRSRDLSVEYRFSFEVPSLHKDVYSCIMWCVIDEEGREMCYPSIHIGGYNDDWLKDFLFEVLPIKDGRVLFLVEFRDCEREELECIFEIVKFCGEFVKEWEREEGLDYFALIEDFLDMLLSVSGRDVSVKDAYSVMQEMFDYVYFEDYSFVDMIVEEEKEDVIRINTIVRSEFSEVEWSTYRFYQPSIPLNPNAWGRDLLCGIISGRRGGRYERKYSFGMYGEGYKLYCTLWGRDWRRPVFDVYLTWSGIDVLCDVDAVLEMLNVGMMYWHDVFYKVGRAFTPLLNRIGLERMKVIEGDVKLFYSEKREEILNIVRDGLEHGMAPD